MNNNTLDILILHSEKINQWLDMPWHTHNSLVVKFKNLLEESPLYIKSGIREINLAGAPGSQFFYLIDNEHLIILVRKPQSINQPFIKELKRKYKINFKLIEINKIVFLVSKISQSVKERLNLSKVLLISLFHPEMYPAARFTLGISSIASYLRHTNCANVEIIDCQFGSTVNELIQHALETRPNIIGLSVNFGQYDLMEQFLDSLNRKKTSKYEPIIILGNVLPAICYEQILEKHSQVLICTGEGEKALAELCFKYKNRAQWKTIPNLYYKDYNGEIICTKPHLMPLESLPPPALDTIEVLMDRKGVLTAEFSRGCQYNICTFCPRKHKGNIWRSLPVASMINQTYFFYKVSKYFQVEPHIFLADEEFIGPDQKGKTLKRIYSYLNGLQSLNIQISFDASCRADQLYNEHQVDDWHIERGILFKKLLSNGLSRLFVGIESGTDNQLKRYRKGYSSASVISAIRYFSLLGIPLRFGFILFDPLMSVQDLCENIEFLGRSDIILTPQTELSVSEIFELVKKSHGKQIKMPSNGNVYENVSYMISPLEVLPNSKYFLDLKEHEPDLLTGKTDISFARVHVQYKIPKMGLLSMACQIWINFCFPIVYTLKGLQKVSQSENKKLLAGVLKTHRYLSYMLLINLAKTLGLIKSETGNKIERLHPYPIDNDSSCNDINGDLDDHLKIDLSMYARLFKKEIVKLNLRADLLPSQKKDIWDKVFAEWINTSILDAPILRKK